MPVDGHAGEGRHEAHAGDGRSAHAGEGGEADPGAYADGGAEPVRGRPSAP